MPEKDITVMFYSHSFKCTSWCQVDSVCKKIVYKQMVFLIKIMSLKLALSQHNI